MLRRSLRLSVWEGAFAELVNACAAGGVITAWALYLGCSPIVIGLLTALPVLSNLAQIPAVLFTSGHGYRRVAIVSVAGATPEDLPAPLREQLRLSS